ncbi:MAG: prepilin peptidase [Candidatus Gastranaerophilales bacterium]|nr:prepilin peptidase [Candidatus Gastranaerophilales bacterium]
MELSSFGTFWQIYILVFTGIIGLIIGSFLNVVILRLLSGESIVFPGSKCPKCSHAIAWYDNIPVISYILLKGKCRNCDQSISIQYPLVEFTTALLFIATVFCFGIGLNLFFLLILISALIVITVTDLKEQVVFDIISMPLIPLGLVYNFFDIANTANSHVKFFALTFNDVFLTAFAGAILGALFFELFARLGLVLVGHRAFGGGDTIIAAALGAWFGWKMLIIVIVLSFALQLLIGIPIILLNMYKDKDFKSLIYMSLLLFSLIISVLGRIFGLTNHFTGALIILLISFGLAGVGVVGVLSRVKERKSYTLLPFGPALVFGGFVVLFFGQNVMNWFINNFHLMQG